MKNKNVLIGVLVGLVIILVAYIFYYTNTSNNLLKNYQIQQSQNNQIYNKDNQSNNVQNQNSHQTLEPSNKQHIYYNDKLNFYVDIPNITVRDATSTSNGVPDEVKSFFITSDDINKKTLMRIDVTSNLSVEWHKNPIDKVIYNGIIFEKYSSVPLGGGPDIFYDTEYGGKLYTIHLYDKYSDDPSILSYFGFVK